MLVKALLFGQSEIQKSLVVNTFEFFNDMLSVHLVFSLSFIYCFSLGFINVQLFWDNLDSHAVCKISSYVDRLRRLGISRELKNFMLDSSRLLLRCLSFFSFLLLFLVIRVFNG